MRRPKPLAGARSHPANPEAGFALLITITLLAFIVVLLVGLAAYTRIETAVAGNMQRQAQARENALLALNVALGHLQQFAGPDQRVTATAEAFPNANGTSRYTGVWHSDPAATASAATPLTWLVSGNELSDAEGTPQTLAITPASAGPAGSLIELVGRNTIGSTSVNANTIRAPLQPLTVKGLPGVPPAAAVTIGRYAWWVGDQGVKAPVALPDTTDAVTYAPYDSDEFRARLRQQMSLGAGAADAASGSPIFDPRESNNAALVANEKVTAFNQLAFLKRSGSTSTTVGQSLIRSNFHVWSPNNLNVLANTKSGGLRQDLSLAPGLLGSAFAAWANYSGYMESFVPPPPPPQPSGGAEPPPPVVRSILPAYSSEPLRRRYPISSGGTDRPRIVPVLSFFGISFSIRNDTDTNDPTRLEVSARCVLGLWNPYTSALVPEDLEIVVSGLPTVVVSSTDGITQLVPLQDRMAGADGNVKFSVPFTTSDTIADRASWLPGRVYNWSAVSTNDVPTAAGYEMEFYRRDATPKGNGMVRDAGPPLGPNTAESVQQYRKCVVEGSQVLTVELRRANDGEVVARFASPVFDAFETDAETRKPGDEASDFAYVFRLPEGAEIPAGESAPWLQAVGRDPREVLFPSTGYLVAGGQPPRPELLVTPKGAGFPATYAHLLLDRYTSAAAREHNEDVPVFELPRRPFLSLGELQHLFVPGARPFAIGNPWGAEVMLNGTPALQSFDRYFFSGVTAEVTPGANAAGDLVLPNRLLRPIRKPDTSKVTADEFRAAPDAFSSKHLLQAGSFNLNSSNVAAWTAVLRGVRFPAAPGFSYLDADPNTGTAADVTASVQSTNAQFFRFPQTAQEVYKVDEKYLQSAPQPEDQVVANTHLFRQGMRALSPAQVAALAARISELVRQRHGDSGPFRSLEEFLSPLTVFAVPGPPAAAGEEPPPGPSRSLLEAAFEASGVNSAIAEFSSQWLTQGDIMTALAPVLFPRSDTFVIRSYGEAINPAKLNNNGSVPATAVEGRAWCEAIVQRVPEFMDPSVPPETPLSAFSTPADPEDSASAPTEASRLNATYGRRFKVVSFRWLTRSDI